MAGAVDGAPVGGTEEGGVDADGDGAVSVTVVVGFVGATPELQAVSATAARTMMPPAVSV